MSGKRNEHDRACGCEQADGSCAALAVRRLNRDRVSELAEGIWTASIGKAVRPSRPIADLQANRPGASALAAYKARRDQERDDWRPGQKWRWAAVAATVLIGGPLLSLSLQPKTGWLIAALAAALVWRELRFHPSAAARLWRRQAAAQRRTATVLQPLEQDNLVLHDIALPGWPTGLDHLVIGPTGAWIVQSWPGRWMTPRRAASTGGRRRVHGGPLTGLRSSAGALAEALADIDIPVRPVMCVRNRVWLGGHRLVEGVVVASLQQLPEVIRRAPLVDAGQTSRAATRALHVLRPAT